MKYALKVEGPKTAADLGDSLHAALKLAVDTCLGIDEEEGGFIVRRGEEYQFHRIINSHTGTPTAIGLYEPNRQEYGDKVIGSYGKGFQNFGSFHTHPTNFPARPSITDLTRLFNGQPVNFIWSPSLRELKQYTFRIANEDYTVWQVNEIDLTGLLD